MKGFVALGDYWALKQEDPLQTYQDNLEQEFLPL